MGKIINGRVFITICIDKGGLQTLETNKYRLHMGLRDVTVKVSKMGRLVDEDPNEEEEMIRELSNACIEDDIL